MQLLLEDNPFFVLGLLPDTSRIELEREAQKLLGMLALGVGDVGTYVSAAGPRPRTPEAVRAAAAQLRDPRQRLLAELMAGAAPPPPAPPAPVAAPGWPDALRRAGWGPR